MSTLSSINAQSDTTYANYKTTAKSSAKTDTTEKETGVIYESAKDQATTSAKTYTQNSSLVSKLKADAEAQTAQLQSIVQKLITGQSDSYGKATDMWQFLASGDFTVDAATKAQAQEDISEDGYWGVNQTSDRILDFAKALTGGDPSKLKEMRSAFEKGFKEATKAWGDDLPGISSQTYDAVMSKFDEWENESSTTTE